MFPLGILSTLAPPAHPPPKKRTNAPRMVRVSATLTLSAEVWETTACMHLKVVIVGSVQALLLLCRLPVMPLAPYPREPVADFRGPVLTNMKDTMCWRERIANEEHTA